MNLYAYCLSDELAEGDAEGAAGVGGAAARVSRCGGLWAVVSEFAGARVEVTRENVSAHNAVLARVLSRTTPLPFRFGTLTSADGLEEFVAARGEKLSGALARVRGCVEMSVKLMRAGAATRGGVAAGALTEGDAQSGDAQTQTRGAEARAGGASSRGAGTEYLAAKRLAWSGDEASKAQAEEAARWLAGALAGSVRETRLRLRPSGGLLLSASHLVERARLAEYRERLRAARAEREGILSFLTSGAWPPYSFCDLPHAKILG